MSVNFDPYFVLIILIRLQFAQEYIVWFGEATVPNAYVNAHTKQVFRGCFVGFGYRRGVFEGEGGR
jgi:hypothetical protein